MNKVDKTKQKRSMPVTIIAGLIGLLALIFILTLLPLKNVPEIILFIGGALVVILSAATAISGHKGGVIELLWSISFWA